MCKAVYKFRLQVCKFEVEAGKEVKFEIDAQ